MESVEHVPNEKLTYLILEWYQKGFWRICVISFMICAKFLKEVMETHKVSPILLINSFVPLCIEKWKS